MFCYLFVYQSYPHEAPKVVPYRHFPVTVDSLLGMPHSAEQVFAMVDTIGGLKCPES